MRGFSDFAISRFCALGAAQLVVLLVLLGCGTAQTDVAQPPTPAPQPQSPPPTDARISEMQVLLAELLDRIEVLNARLQRLESAASTPSSPPATAQTARPPAKSTLSPPLTGGALAEKYRAALTFFGKGQLDQSRKLFQEVFDFDVNGDLADNALYWIAETYFVTAKYSEAMTIYRRILKDYSDENKAPDAMLKMGLAYVKLGDLALARTTFEQLVQKYPYSTPAAAAKLEIKRIQY